jgi:uncharacterized membrane protein
MELLIAGLLLWSIVHLIPSMGISFKAGVVDRLGYKGYSAIFALLIVASVVLMVFGWRAAQPVYLYTLPGMTKSVALALMVIAFILMGAANYPTRIKRVIRHPQLTGVTVWSLAHLLLNGDSRSVILFGGIGCWAVLAMVMINRRDGEWLKPEASSWAKEVVGILISLIVMAAVVWLHPYIAGVPVK